MLYDDAGVVYTAQKNRLGYCGFRRGLKSKLVVPLPDVQFLDI